MLSIDDGVTVTFSKPIRAGVDYQIFSGSGADQITWTNGAQPGRPSVKWWGAIGDGSGNDHQAFQDALDCLIPRGLFLYVPFGEYRITSQLVIPRNGSNPHGLYGDGRDKSRLKFIGLAQATDAMTFYLDTEGPDEDHPNCMYFRMSGMKVSRNTVGRAFSFFQHHANSSSDKDRLKFCIFEDLAFQCTDNSTDILTSGVPDTDSYGLFEIQSALNGKAVDIEVDGGKGETKSIVGMKIGGSHWWVENCRNPEKDSGNNFMEISSGQCNVIGCRGEGGGRQFTYKVTTNRGNFIGCHSEGDLEETAVWWLVDCNLARFLNCSASTPGNGTSTSRCVKFEDSHHCVWEMGKISTGQEVGGKAIEVDSGCRGIVFDRVEMQNWSFDTLAAEVTDNGTETRYTFLQETSTPAWGHQAYNPSKDTAGLVPKVTDEVLFGSENDWPVRLVQNDTVRVAITSADVFFNLPQVLNPQSSDPSEDTAAGRTRIYVKGDKLVFMHNDSGVFRYYYADMTSGADITALTYSATAP